MDRLLRLPQLLAEGQRALVDFLETDVALCFTFTDLALIDIDSPESSTRALASAEQGYATITHLLLRVSDPSRKEALNEKLGALRVRLDGVQQQVRRRYGH